MVKHPTLGWRRGAMALSAAAMVLGAMAASPIPTAHADEVKMSGAEIAETLTGNSVEGWWGEAHYRSYFDASGVTLYQPKGSDIDQGNWFVQGDQYCSSWGPAQPNCYDLYRNGGTVIWVVPASGKRYDSTLIAGKAVPW